MDAGQLKSTTQVVISCARLEETNSILGPILSIFVSGHGYAGYGKTLVRGLGLGLTSEKPYMEVFDIAIPHIKERLDEM